MIAPAEPQGREAAATIFVCTTCRRKREDAPLGYDLPGSGGIAHVPPPSFDPESVKPKT